MLTSQRFEEIKIMIANVLEDYNITKLPIDVFGLAKKMGIMIIRASNASLEKYNVVKKCEDSSVFYEKNIQKFIIYLDDRKSSVVRQRFSVAHEIMHIILGHTEQNKDNEAEANYGAEYLLAPSCLVLMDFCDLLVEKSIVIKWFKVSNPLAEILVRRFEKRNMVSHIELEYETRINDLLRDSFHYKYEKYLR